MNTEKPIAILPAAGRGTRLGLKGTSKELVSIGFSEQWPNGRPVIDHLLERLQAGGVQQAQIVTLVDKIDIRPTLGEMRHSVGLQYLETPATPSSVHTVCVALRKGDASQRWVLGFPDILFEPKTAYRQVLERLVDGVDLVLGLFPSDRPEKTDMVELDPRGRVVDIRIKQPHAYLKYTWSIACWSRRFSELLLEATACASSPESKELFVGNVMQTAIRLGLDIVAVPFPNGWALDVGTVEDLARARAQTDNSGEVV